MLKNLIKSDKNALKNKSISYAGSCCESQNVQFTIWDDEKRKKKESGGLEGEMQW